MSDMVGRLGDRLAHQRSRPDDAVEPGVVDHLQDGADSASFRPDQLSPGALKLHLARGVRSISQFVLEPLDMEGVS